MGPNSRMSMVDPTLLYTTDTDPEKNQREEARPKTQGTTYTVQLAHSGGKVLIPGMLITPLGGGKRSMTSDIQTNRAPGSSFVNKRLTRSLRLALVDCLARGQFIVHLILQTPSEPPRPAPNRVQYLQSFKLRKQISGSPLRYLYLISLEPNL